MPDLIVGPMLRHVMETSATIFVETDAPCQVQVASGAVVLGRTKTFTVRRHHYALVILEGLEPGATIPYSVELDGEVRWPEADPAIPVPPSVIRTCGRPGPVRLLFGSCRTAAPHEPPYTLELARDDRGRGVDAMWAHAMRMMSQPIEEWPDLMVMMGDQVYADDSSPATRERIDRRRSEGEELPSEIVRDFEEYCWLYHESWKPAVERWFFSCVPTTMIFDDHDMIDDWNISERWVREVRQQPWWDEHVVGGLVSYWVYQHLGNQSLEQVRADGLLASALELDDAEPLLREWARASEALTPVAGGYQFSYARELGSTRLVVLDARNARVLDGSVRKMMDDEEWAWFEGQCRAPVDHLVIVSSLPVFVPGALHDIQVWNEALCAGRWGQRAANAGERMRRSIDLEDWPAFATSFDAMAELLAEVGSAEVRPHTITVLSGDIHFSYTADVTFPPSRGVRTPIRQVVCSPLRNALTPAERGVIRFALSRRGRAIGRLLRRAAGRRRTACRWELVHGPTFANCIGVTTLDGRTATTCVEQATVEDGEAPTISPVFQDVVSSSPVSGPAHRGSSSATAGGSRT